MAAMKDLASHESLGKPSHEGEAFVALTVPTTSVVFLRGQFLCGARAKPGYILQAVAVASLANEEAQLGASSMLASALSLPKLTPFGRNMVKTRFLSRRGDNIHIKQVPGPTLPSSSCG